MEVRKQFDNNKDPKAKMSGLVIVILRAQPGIGSGFRTNLN